jgi:exo-1,4-beta-D-glucosaminidase
MVTKRSLLVSLSSAALLVSTAAFSVPAAAAPAGGHISSLGAARVPVTRTVGAALSQASGAIGQPGTFTLGLGSGGWRAQTTAATTDWTSDAGATEPGQQISTPGFDTSSWLPVTADDAGAPGTEVEALLQNGICPDDESQFPTGTITQAASGPDSIFYSNNLQDCFYGPHVAVQSRIGPTTNPLFDVPWWFQTNFSSDLAPGQDAKLVVQGIVGQADIWVNGTEVATQATVEGDYASYTFDVTNLLVPGTNSLALEVYPNNPNLMLTLDNVDWAQMSPDNNTGIQFPVSLHVSDVFGISNVYVEQKDAPDMSSAALSVHADVTNNTELTQTATVNAMVAPPEGGGAWIQVAQPVTVPPSTTEALTFSPASFPQLDLQRPQLWWPYQMGGQPLYTLYASVRQGPLTEDVASPVTFGIRSVTTYLTPPSGEAPDGVRVFEVNGVPFVFRGGGWSENLFLHYSASDLANQIALIKSMGLNGIRTEGKEMPQNFYEQMDAAGILIDGGFQCCDAWAPSSSGRGVTTQEYHVMYESALTIGQQLRDHPSVLNFSWSDNAPIPEQEVASEQGFAQSGFQGPIVSSAEYNDAALYGPSGEKEGPYDWVPPGYWYDTTHDSNTAVDPDNTETNVGGSFGFDSEQSAGDTVPTMDSISRFMSPADQEALWECPGYHQFHTNYESSTGNCPAIGDGTTTVIGAHEGYSFGTLYNLDAAIQARYGTWHSLAQYVQEAQVQNYEDTRAQFEAFIDHWDNYPTPSTGTDYWQLNKGWPTLLWDIYNYDYDEAGSYFGAEKANEAVHVLYALDTGEVTIDNLSGVNQRGLSVQSRVYSLSGTVLDDQTAHNLNLAPQQVTTGVLTPKVPATTTPPTRAQTYFVELVLRQRGQVVDRNVYWLSTQQDVVDWEATEGNPQASVGSPSSPVAGMTQYGDMTALQSLPTEQVQVVAATAPAKPTAPAPFMGPGAGGPSMGGPGAGELTTYVTINNPKSNPAVAFFLRADIRRGTPNGTEQAGDNEILPVTYSDNDVTLWPGESQTIAATYSASALDGATAVVSVFGWNVGTAAGCGSSQSCSASPLVVAAPEGPGAMAGEGASPRQPGIEYFGLADGSSLTPGSAAPQTGLDPVPAPQPTLLTATQTAYSPTTTPDTSFTQGDGADTYTITVTNSGHVQTDGATPVTVTDVVGNNFIDLSETSVTGTGWSCDDSQSPTIVCTEDGGPGGGPAVLMPGQSYPPITLTVSVANTAGYGTQDSVAGLHVTNSVTVTGGAPSNASYTTALATPIVGLPSLINDYAIDGAFQQGDASDQYQETVINQGAGPTNGNPATPITATFRPGAGETIMDLYGSGWTCNLATISSPYNEPADTCYRTDVLQGENGEEPPITEVVSVSGTATSDTTTATEPSVVADGGGNATGPATTRDATTILSATPSPSGTNPPGSPELTATSTQAGSFAQGDAADAYRIEVTNAASGGTSSGTVTVTDRLPAGLTAQEMSGAGWICSLAPMVLPPTARGAVDTFEPQPTCTRADALAPGQSYPPITLTVAVANYAQPSVVNAVSVTGGGMVVPVTTTDPTAVTQLPYLSVTSQPSSHGLIYAPFTQGDEPVAMDDYSVTLANDGFAPTVGPVTLSVDLPDGLVPYAVSGPSGWACSLATVTCTTDSPIPAGAEVGITLQVTVAPDAPAWAQAVIQATGGGEVPTPALDLDNDYNIVENGGVFIQPTYTTSSYT